MVKSDRRIARKVFYVLASALVFATSGSGALANPASDTKNVFRRPDPILGIQSRTIVETAELPSMSDSFVDSIGADSHFSYDNSPYATKFGTIGPLVARSGLRHLRDADRGTVYAAKMNYLAARGVRHSLGFTVGDTAATINTALANFGSQIDFAEPANEWDTTSKTNPHWVAQLQSLQKLLFQTIRANPAFKTLPILGPSLADGNYYPELGNLDAYADAGNLHSSTCDFQSGDTELLFEHPLRDGTSCGRDARSSDLDHRDRIQR